MNKKIPANLRHLPNIPLLLLSLVSTTLSAAEHQNRPCIIDLDSPTDRTIYFANDTTPHLYPEEITNQLAMVKAAKETGLFGTQRVIDFSHTPDLTAEKFNALVAIMYRNAMPKDDQDFLDLLSTADTLLEEDDIAHIKIIEALMERVKSKEDQYRDPHSPRRHFFDLFTNQQAGIFIRELRKIANKEIIYTNHYTGVRYHPEIEDDSYRVAIWDYKIRCCDGTEGFPIPNANNGKPTISPLPTSIQTLIDAKKMPEICTLDRQKGGLSLYHADLTSLTGLPSYPDFPNLSYINLNCNYLTHIPAHAFANTPNLTEIYLKKNRLQSIDPEAFKGLNRLQSLYLDDNQLTTIDMKTFSALPNLKMLDLSDNQITTITLKDSSQITTYRYSDELELLPNCSIYLSDNPITGLSDPTGKTNTHPHISNQEWIDGL